MNFRLFIILLLLLSSTGIFSQGGFVGERVEDASLVGSPFNSNLSSAKLKLINTNAIVQMNNTTGNRFDLSGIVSYNNDIYVIADKEWNKFLYKLELNQNIFTVSESQNLCLEGVSDFEGIDNCSDSFFLIEESKSSVYEFTLGNCILKKLSINWSSVGVDYSQWGNKGFEGIAIDCKNKVMYLAKERQERRIFKVDLVSGVITEPFKSYIDSNEEGYDIADMKFENGVLYILERGHGLITKIDVLTKRVKSYSFQNIVLKNNQRLFDNNNPNYGMAESLLLTKNKIWIGLDNNGAKVSDYGKSFGLKSGTDPVFLIFERPIGF